MRINKIYLTILISILLLSAFGVEGQENSKYNEEMTNRMDWWEDARFGMFLHWGVYSAFGGEWENNDYGKEMGGPSAEWIYLKADITKSAYQEAALQFNPIHYNPKEWVKMAKDAGMKYMVLTSKHHDGFAMFDTDASDWNIMQASKYKLDIIKSYVDECHKQGMRIGLYYSHEKDWIHSKKVRKDTSKITEEYKLIVQTHLKELLGNYGQIDLIWFDMGISEHEELNKMCYKMVREYQPNCIISSRIGSGLGDYKNLGDRELAQPGDDRYVESIMTLRLNWGFDHNDSEWKSSDELISMLSKCACRNSNFLLNIGPSADGRFSPEEVSRLENMGEWMNSNSEAIYCTEGSPFKGEYLWGSLTHNKNKVYLHLFGDYGKSIEVNGISSQIKKAYWLHNNTKVEFSQNLAKSELDISLSGEYKDQTVPILVLELDDNLQVNLQKGPNWLAEPIQHTARESIYGEIISVEGSTFTLKFDDKLREFSFNDNTIYRVNKNGSIELVNGYYPEIGKTYRITYRVSDKGLAQIITEIIN
ncbi:MAG: alpha-L-fucosidase [Bacteroidales bacterium]